LKLCDVKVGLMAYPANPSIKKEPEQACKGLFRQLFG